MKAFQYMTAGVLVASLLGHFSVVSAATAEELAAKQRDLMQLKIENQIKEEQAKAKGAKDSGNASAPAYGVPGAVNTFNGPSIPGVTGQPGLREPGGLKLPASIPDDSDFKLVGIFGIGNDLEAEVVYKETTLPMKVGMSVNGWALSSIDSRAVTLRKVFTAKRKPHGAYEVIRTVTEVPATKKHRAHKLVVTQYAKTLHLYLSMVSVQSSGDESANTNMGKNGAGQNVLPVPIPTVMPMPIPTLKQQSGK